MAICRNIFSLLFFISGCLNCLTPALASNATDVPDLAKEIERYQAQSQQPGKPSPFSKQDMEVMQRSAQELAKHMPDPGLKVGDKAPSFTLPNAFGKQVSLQTALDSRPVVLMFYRGSWCPFCNLQLHAMQKVVPQIKQHGASLIAVTPQRPDKSLEQVKKSKLPFEILSDLDSKVMKAYKLYFEVPPDLIEVYKKFELDLADYNGSGRYVLPVPGTFVIDRQGVVRAVFADTDYKKRMEPRDILAALEFLSGEKTQQVSH